LQFQLSAKSNMSRGALREQQQLSLAGFSWLVYAVAARRQKAGSQLFIEPTGAESK